ncbi:MAG: putative tyrosine/tryptophan transport protein [Chlamydiales bacterium]|jgi:tyrosine-specific transport protein|nr:putative tyrosine/tryptophan transport protein [Chlamydiales bacterium]
MPQLPSLQKGSLLGGILLLSGSCIGIGMFALPVLTAQSGFLPTLLLLLLCWGFMLTTALLFLEANLWYKEPLSIISLADKTLGLPGKATAWSTFLFLFYSLLVAYLSKGGDLLSLFLKGNAAAPYGIELLSLTALIATCFGTHFSERLNRLLMFGLFFTYLFLIAQGIPYYTENVTLHRDWSYSLLTIPFIVTSFGFHNMVPTLKNYLGGDYKKLFLTLFIGSLIPLTVYTIWEYHIFKIVPLDTQDGSPSLLQSFRLGQISTEPLASKIPSLSLQIAAYYLSFFAIATSLLAQALSLIDFLGDGLNFSTAPKKNRLLASLLVFLPPYLISKTYPHVFFIALELVGGVAAMILFALLPVLMVWRGRYHLQKEPSPLAFGGRPLLIVIFLLSFSLLSFEITKWMTW